MKIYLHMRASKRGSWFGIELVNPQIVSAYSSRQLAKESIGKKNKNSAKHYHYIKTLTVRG